MLQFFQDELRNEQCTVDESRLTYIGNASVDDDARIEQLVELGRFLFPADLPQRFLGLRLRLRFAALADQIRQRAEKIADFLALLDRDMNAEIAEHDAENDRKICSDERDLGKRRSQ